MITTTPQQPMFDATSLQLPPNKNVMLPACGGMNKSRMESISTVDTASSTSSTRTLDEEEEEDHSIESNDADDEINQCNTDSHHQQQQQPPAQPSNNTVQQLTVIPVESQPTAVTASVSPLLHTNANVMMESHGEVEDEVSTEDAHEPRPLLREATQQQPTSATETTGRDCRRTCLKDTSHESIPLRNHGWKNLPKLTIPNIQSKLIVTPKASQHNKEPKSTSAVQFRNIEIRSYDICVGDNPSVSYGTPLSLDWNYVVELNDTVERYESVRSLTKRRNMRQMMMNYNYRRNILLLHWNATEDELFQSANAMNVIRAQRNMTRTLLPLSPLEDCMTSLYRKIQRRRARRAAAAAATTTATPAAPTTPIRTKKLHNALATVL